MTKPFTITASVGPKISSDEVSKLKREDIVSVVLSEDDLHKGVIIKTPYGKQRSFQILNNKNNTME